MKNVAKKLLKVTEALDGKVKKSGYNNYSKYSYVTEADLIDAIRPELIRQGLVITTSVHSFSETGATEDDDNRYASVTLKHVIIDAESGECLELFSAGTGADRLDKALYKSYTGAIKYFLLKTFMLSGDDDPENDGGKKPAPKPAFQKSTTVQDKPAAKPKQGMFQKKQAQVEEPEEIEEEEEKPKPKVSANTASKPSFNKFAKATKPKVEEPEEEEDEETDDEEPAF